MQSENIIGKFCADVCKEYNAFKKDMLNRDNKYIFDHAYSISFYNEMYSFVDYVEYDHHMLEQADISDSEMVKILKEGNICSNLYEILSDRDEAMPICYSTIVQLLEIWAYDFRMR